MSRVDRITVYGPAHWHYADSYGLICCQLARHLTALGVRVNAVGLGYTVMDNQPPDVRAVTSQPIKPAFGGLALGYPTSYAKHGALLEQGPKVALTMFESSKIPPGWAPILNTYDAVIVPSTFCWDVFASCGVTVPIYVIPLGVNDVYRTIQRSTDRPFTFLAFLDRGKRKGGLVALQAFLKAFGGDPDYRLILKSRKPKVCMEILNENVELIQQDMTEDELCQLYGRSDCLVNPNMGEGFGLLPREFAATGGISLATGWGGTADDIWEWGIPLPYRLIKADWAGVKKFEGMDLGQWAQPDIEGIAQNMQDVAAQRETHQHQAMADAPRVQRMYSWRTFAERVLGVWNEVANGNCN